jgi:hypothetical protein
MRMQQNLLRKTICGILLTSSSALWAPSALSSNGLDSVLKSGEQRANKAIQSQLTIDEIDADIRRSEGEYRTVSKEIEGLEVYIQQLNKQLAAQETEKKEIERSIRQVTLIERQITPLMLRMIDALGSFVMADVPFQKQERLARVKGLKQLMGRSDVTVAEKYRKVMDAYQKEMDYGRTIKTYRSTINLSNKAPGLEREVDFLRVGRISLMFLSLDGESLGIWDHQTKQWQPLDAEYKGKLTAALRIAREQAAPDLIKVPVVSPSKSNLHPNLNSNSNLANGEIQ